MAAEISPHTKETVLSNRKALLAKQELLIVIGLFLADLKRELEIQLEKVTKELQDMCGHPNMRKASSMLDPDLDIIEDCPDCGLHRET